MRSDLPYPNPSSDAVSAVMRGVKRTDTRPERKIRSLLHQRGLRFRKDFLIRTSEVRVRADIVFTRQRVAVFIDGCFWHSCPEHGNQPRVNRGYWQPKLARNVERDRRVGVALSRDGWKVLRIWEHVSPEEAADAISGVVGVSRG